MISRRGRYPLKNNKPYIYIYIYIYYHFIEVVAISYFRCSKKELEDVAVGSAGRALWPSTNTSFRCKRNIKSRIKVFYTLELSNIYTRHIKCWFDWFVYCFSSRLRKLHSNRIVITCRMKLCSASLVLEQERTM